MKKTVAALAAGMIVSMTPVASAGPVTISGDAAIKYQRDTAEGESRTSGSIYTLKLMGEASLGDGWALYARLGGQRVTSPLLADFNTASGAYGENEKSVLALDQFGVKYKADTLTYKLGRQDVTIGTTALLYNRPDTNIGKKTFADGLSVAGTVGTVDVSAVAAREDNAAGEYKNKLYAIRAGYSPTEKFNWGLTLGRFQGEAESTDHWAVDGTYKFGKNSLTAEYTQSSSNIDNQAYALAWNYELDGKTAVTVTGFRVEENGSMGGQSDFDANNRGVHYGFTRKLNDAATLELVYKDQKTINGGQNNTSFEATLSYAF